MLSIKWSVFNVMKKRLGKGAPSRLVHSGRPVDDHDKVRCIQRCEAVMLVPRQAMQKVLGTFEAVKKSNLNKKELKSRIPNEIAYRIWL